MNRSWYKNTWLGKKLGLRIDWIKENLVYRDSSGDVKEVLHLLEDDVYYIGFIVSSGCSLQKDDTYKDYYVKQKIIKGFAEIDFKKYKIEYDPTKKEAFKRVANILKETDEKYETKVFYLGSTAKYGSYEVPVEFRERTSKFVTNIDVVHDEYNNSHVRITFNKDYRYNVIVMVNEHIRK